MAISWYAMGSKPNQEQFLAGQLEAHGIQVFYPCIRVQTMNPRARKVRPYFPGYLFVQVDLEMVGTSELRWMPGASGLISFDGKPVAVSDLLIAAVQRQVHYINISGRDSVDRFRPGDIVIVKEGLFAGYEAIFDRELSGRDHVRVLLSFLQKRQVPLELQEQQIERVNRS